MLIFEGSLNTGITVNQEVRDVYVLLANFNPDEERKQDWDSYSAHEDTDILSALISLRPATTVLRPCLYLHRKTCSVLFPGFIWVPAHTEGGRMFLNLKVHKL